jgi:cell division septal protein FtsQ
MFKKRKLATSKKYRYQYGKSPVLHQTVKKNQKTLRGGGPTSFHTKKRKRLTLSQLHKKIPPKAKKLSIALGVIGAGILLIYTTLFSQYLYVETIKISTEQLGTPQLSGNIIDDLSTYKGKNILFVSKDEIIEKIQKGYPEIENIKINKDLPSTIIISFSEYPLIANITNISNESNKKFVINSIGYVVKEDTDDPNLPYIKVKTDAPLNTESSIIEQDTLDYLLGATSYFEEKFGMQILETEYKVIPREVHLRTEKYFHLWIDIQKPYENQLKKLKKALVKLDIYNSPLEYIDLRITGESGEKIIYKRR